MEDITFGNTAAFWYLLIIPAFYVIYVLIFLKNKKQNRLLGNANIVNQMRIEKSQTRTWFKFSVIMLSFVALIFAIARPQFVTETKVDAGDGNEIIIALDISNSMLASSDDPNLSRLNMAKNSIFKFLENLRNEKLGLVVFAGQAVLQIPLTQDYSAFQLILNSIKPSYLTAQGTDIAAAINLGVSSFTPDNKNLKTLILISDGEDHEGNIEEAIEKAKSDNVVVYTIGIGSARGNPVYIDGKALTDENGDIVISKLNETILKQIANETKGEYYNFNNKTHILKEIYTNSTSKEDNGKTKISKLDEKYHYFVFPAFLLLLFEFFILTRKNRWLAKINIFN